MRLLATIPYSSNDAVLCERNLDHIYRLNGKTPLGHVLLVVNPDVHAEMRQKIKVTAELAFESVTEFVAPKIEEQYANDKFRQMNNLFRHTALTVQNQFQWPWLWLEPDCVPVKADWIKKISEAYHSQPKKYMGLLATPAGGAQFMARVGVYLPTAGYELESLCQSGAPFPIATSEKVVPRASNTKLIQYLNIETFEDLSKISESAVVVHGDRQGIIAENWRPRDAAGLKGCVIPSTRIDSEFVEALREELNKPESVPIKDLGNREVVISKETILGLGEVTMLESNPPRLTRRQQRELENKAAAPTVGAI